MQCTFFDAILHRIATCLILHEDVMNADAAMQCKTCVPVALVSMAARARKASAHLRVRVHRVTVGTRASWVSVH